MTLHRSLWFLIGVLVGTYDGAPAQIRSSDRCSAPIAQCRSFVGVTAVLPDLQPAADPDTHPDCENSRASAMPIVYATVQRAEAVIPSFGLQTPDIHPQQPRGQPR